MNNKAFDGQSNAYTPKFSILVVDDDLQVATAIRNILVEEGFDVETAGDGRQAIDLLTKCQHFDLVITDMKMPEMDGLEVLRQAHQYKKYLPVIVTTGYPTIENGIQCVEAGVYNYIVKPFEARNLLKLVKDGLKTSFMNHSPPSRRSTTPK